MQQDRGVVTEKPGRGKPAIIISNITKEFIIPHERKTTFFENLKGAFQPSTYEKFTALRDVSFTVERGDSVGIIGDNGSGKSTLLKIISRILRPTSGSMEVNGKITPFLELGVGFQPDLTARENIAIYSTIMGLSEKEIARNMDAVLEFAGIGLFKDTKIKNFSSGMLVRLAFATAIQSKPDILIVDEVLAVGDIEFQRKCLDIFQQYKDEKVTILFVSHDLNAIRRFCDKTVLLESGRVAAFGNTGEIIDQYIYKLNSGPLPEKATGDASDGEVTPAQEPEIDGDAESAEEDSMEESSLEYIIRHRSDKYLRWGNKKIELLNVRLVDKNGHEGNTFVTGDPMSIFIEYHNKEDIVKPIFGFDISGEDGAIYYGTNTLIKGMRLNDIKQKGQFVIRIEELPLLQGKYYLSVAAQSEDCSITYDWHNKKYPVYVVNNGNEEGLVRFKCNLSVD